MKKICILTSVHPAFDVRIFHKEAKTLVKAGYDVTLIARHNKNETVDGVKIIALSKPGTRFRRIFRMTWKIYRLAKKQKANVYHFHDPELLLVGIVLRLLGKKVIYDVHEDVPQQILYKEWIRNICVREFTAAVVHVIEHIGVFFFNVILAATVKIAKKFPESKTIILRNFPDLELIENGKPIHSKKNKSIIVYAGGLNRPRGIREIVQAMEFVGNKAELWLLGEWISEEFEKECKALDGWKYTKHLGFVHLGKVYKHLKGADIGISILYPIKNYVTSLPTKTFEYMACSLPVVMSDFPYWQRIFEECALFADPYSPEDIADRILYLLDNPDKAKQFGGKGRQLIEEKYSWENESKKLLKVYEELHST
jgi:glycosyltransferase involved in cell wall biosynthesis